LMDQMGQMWCREFFWPREMDCNRSSDQHWGLGYCLSFVALSMPALARCLAV
jgi:hypothetical protein